jgi:hypothetical protein
MTQKFSFTPENTTDKLFIVPNRINVKERKKERNRKRG